MNMKLNILEQKFEKPVDFVNPEKANICISFSISYQFALEGKIGTIRLRCKALINLSTLYELGWDLFCKVAEELSKPYELNCKYLHFSLRL